MRNDVAERLTETPTESKRPSRVTWSHIRVTSSRLRGQSSQPASADAWQQRLSQTLAIRPSLRPTRRRRRPAVSETPISASIARGDGVRAVERASVLAVEFGRYRPDCRLGGGVRAWSAGGGGGGGRLSISGPSLGGAVSGPADVGVSMGWGGGGGAADGGGGEGVETWCCIRPSCCGQSKRPDPARLRERGNWNDLDRRGKKPDETINGA